MENNKMTIKEMATRLADICYAPKEHNSKEHAMQLFIEEHVLPKDCTGYTDDEMSEYIVAYLESKD